MITLDRLRQHPQLFRPLTGIDHEEFARLYERLQRVYQDEERARRSRPQRVRAIGGGRQHKLDLGNRLLMTLIYAHLPVTQPLLGRLFGINDSNVSREIQVRMLPVLERLRLDAVASRLIARRSAPRRSPIYISSTRELLATLPELTPLLGEWSGESSRPLVPTHQRAS